MTSTTQNPRVIDKKISWLAEDLVFGVGAAFAVSLFIESSMAGPPGRAGPGLSVHHDDRHRRWLPVARALRVTSRNRA